MDWDLKSFEKRVLDKKKIAMLKNLQKGLLENSLKLVKPNGGIVIYATCSLSRQQNETVVEEVLKQPSFKNCKLVDALECFQPEIKLELLENKIYGVEKGLIEGTYRFIPDSYSTGGLFLAKIVKK